MKHVKGRDLFGNGPSKEIPCIPGNGIPTTATEGAVGCLYLDTSTKPARLWVCTAAENGVYSWQEISEMPHLALSTSADDGDNGVMLYPEGTAEAPRLTMYGKDGDEAVMLGNVADAVDDLDAPNLSQVKRLINQIPQFAVEVVAALPAVGVERTLYLVPFADAEGSYMEYLYVNGAWEMLGSKKVDLAGYATEEWVTEQLGQIPAPVQADWEQADPTQLSHVLHRPFYDDTVTTYVVELPEPGYGHFHGGQLGDAQLVAGETYDVAFGTEESGEIIWQNLQMTVKSFTAAADYFSAGIYSGDTVLYLGNLKAIDKSLTDTGEDFIIYNSDRGGTVLRTVAASNSISYRVSVSQTVRNFQPIAEKFIPDSVRNKALVVEMGELTGNEDEYGKELTASHTYEEVMAALDAGRSVLVFHPDVGYYYLSDRVGEALVFSDYKFVTGDYEGIESRTIFVDGAGWRYAWRITQIPTDEHINELINTALGVIENGTY